VDINYPALNWRVDNIYTGYRMEWRTESRSRIFASIPMFDNALTGLDNRKRLEVGGAVPLSTVSSARRLGARIPAAIIQDHARSL
jgi:hypothetical protein